MRKFASYRDLAEIGHGGMGVVYRATAPHGNLVAIKILDRNLAADPTARLRFRQESSLPLMHPNVVRVLEHGEQDGQPYIVMEYVAGESLDQLITRKGRFTPAEFAPILTDVARALDHAHKHGIIHRDVKPSNILIRSNGQAVLGDFGVAKSMKETAYTATMTRWDSALYMSPEQAAGLYNLTPASDIYSLAVTAYFALSGRHPFEGANEIAVARMHIDTTPQPLHVLDPAIHKPVSDKVAWALHKKPAFRPLSAGQFANEFRQALSAPVMPKVAPPVESPPGRASRAASNPPEAPQKTIRPHHIFLALVTTGIVVALAAVALGNAGTQSPESASPAGPRIEAGPDASAATQPPTGDASAPEPTPTTLSLLLPPLVDTPAFPTITPLVIVPPLPALPTETAQPVLPTFEPTHAPIATAPVYPTAWPTVTPTPPEVTPPTAPSATPTATASSTPSTTPTPTETPPTPTETPSPTPSPTATPTVTATPSPTAEATSTLTPTDIPTEVPTEIPTEMPTEAPTETATASGDAP